MKDDGDKTVWPSVPLGSVLTDLQTGFASGVHNSSGVGIAHLRPMNVATDGRIERAVVKYVDPRAGRSALRLHSGDILFNNTNSPELVGKTALFEDHDEPAFSNHMTRLRTDATQADPRYVALRLHQAWRDGWFAAHCKNHVSQASIGRDVLETFQIELPPLKIQRRIAQLAAVIDERRKSGVNHIALAGRVVEQFRRSLLSEACSGRLTADWRGRHSKPAPEPKRPVTRPRQFRDIEGFDLDEIPDSWKWDQVDDLLPPGGIFDGPFGSNLKSDDYTTVGARVIRLENIGHLDFIDRKKTYVSKEKYRDLARHAVRSGDIVFSSFIEENVRVCVLPNDIEHEALAKADCFTLRPSGFVNRSYLAMQLASPRTYRYLASDVHGATRPRINTTQLRSVPVPLCSREEQDEIVQRFSRLSSIVQRLLGRIDRTSALVERTSSATLAKAFRGELLNESHDGDISSALTGRS